jgi:hypothetical protein
MSERPQLNAIGKPMSTSFDPNYKVRTPLTSIGRLRAPMLLSTPRVSGPDEEQRWKAVKACIAKAAKAQRRAENFYITAGQHLNALKAEHGGNWAEWEALLKTRLGISTGRASELMQLADGRKTFDELKEGAAERKRQQHLRDVTKKIPPPRGGESAPAPEAAAEVMKIEAMSAQPKSESETEQPRRRTRLERELDAGAFNRLRDEQAHNEGLAEKLRAAEIKIVGLESEVEELKTENARLRAELRASS